MEEGGACSMALASAHPANVSVKWVGGLSEASEGLLGCLSGASSRPLGGAIGGFGETSWGLLGASADLLSLWGLSRGSLGVYWAHLGMEGSTWPFAFPLLSPSWDLTLLVSWALLGASGAVLGPSQAVLVLS